MTSPYQAEGTNAQALFTLKIHRGESMVLIAMNWRNGQPPDSFVGWFISYKSPGSTAFAPVMNRIGFTYDPKQPSAEWTSTEVSPIQKFRWVHFPPDAEKAGSFTYRVLPVNMDGSGKLSYGAPQQADIDLNLETYPGELNVAFTRGFVSSQAFVDRYLAGGHTLDEIIPDNADDGLDFKPTHPKAQEALEWMGFEARDAILKLLDGAIGDPAAQVDAIVYDFNVPLIFDKLLKLAPRLRIIFDDSKSIEKGKDKGHDRPDSPESTAAGRLEAAGAKVKRQHMGSLQHNKTIVIRGGSGPGALCGSTNLSWRGLYIQANNAIVLKGQKPAEVFGQAFDSYWSAGSAADFSASPSAAQPWRELGLADSKAAVTFSPHSNANAVLDNLGAYVSKNTTSSVLFALAFLYESKGSLRDAITGLATRPDIFVYGMSDRKVDGIDFKMADGHMAVVYPDYLTNSDTPADFKAELSSLPAGGSMGTRLHHKFIVTDFNKPTARVYMGSFNFSGTADTKNGENLLVFEDPRVATAYMVEALRLFDHYEWRVKHHTATDANAPLLLRKPPSKPGDNAWWKEDWTDKRKASDRLLFS